MVRLVVLGGSCLISIAEVRFMGQQGTGFLKILKCSFPPTESTL